MTRAGAAHRRTMALVLSCEHGGQRVPARYRHLFENATADLESHRGWDRGALHCAQRLSKSLDAPLIAATTTRLLVDLNRSLWHPRLFSPWTAPLSEPERGTLLARHYHPHRQRLRSTVLAHARRAPVLHIAVHSFAPELDGVERRADLGLLYDPRRPSERRWCATLRQWLRREAPELTVRRNYPYLGRTDGLTTCLRRELADRRYLGIELEINQRLAERRAPLDALCRLLARGIACHLA